jgi:hypothetical protein
LAWSKSNKPLKSPHKEQIEEQNKQNKTGTTPTVTPHTTKTSKRSTGAEERPEKRDPTKRKYVQNPEHIPYYEGDLIHRRINRSDRHKEQFDEAGDIINSSDNDFMQPSDEDPQGNVLTEEEQALIKMNDPHRTPNKEHKKQAAQPENEDSPPSPESDRKDPVNMNTKLTTWRNASLPWPETLNNNSENREKNTQWKLRPWNK